MEGTVCDAAKRESRHMELMYAIAHLNDSKKQLERLYEKVVGSQDKPQKDPKGNEVERAPNLAETLIKAPKEINNIAEQIYALTNNLEEVLF